VGVPLKIALARAALHASTTSLTAWRRGFLRKLLCTNGTAVAITKPAIPITIINSIKVKAFWRLEAGCRTLHRRGHAGILIRHPVPSIQYLRFITD
jgi:hypothetical protein